MTSVRVAFYRLAALLFIVSSILFFALRMAGDPALILAGQDASPELIERIRADYGFDRPLVVQYFSYMRQIVLLDFGDSLATGEPALAVVADHLPATLLLAVLAMTVTVGASIPLGAWLGQNPESGIRRFVTLGVAIAQGTPGFVVALVLVQVFVVVLGWLPSLGYADPRTWILPSIALSFFLAPKLIRVVAANVAEALREDYVRAARASGASEAEILWRVAMPNALLGATALIGTQFAFLVSGAVLIEVLFLWPGVGLLLLRSAQNLDFPVLQAITAVVAVLVFVVNLAADGLIRWLDPRARQALAS